MPVLHPVFGVSRPAGRDPQSYEVGFKVAARAKLADSEKGEFNAECETSADTRCSPSHTPAEKLYFYLGASLSSVQLSFLCQLSYRDTPSSSGLAI